MYAEAKFSHWKIYKKLWLYYLLFPYIPSCFYFCYILLKNIYENPLKIRYVSHWFIQPTKNATLAKRMQTVGKNTYWEAIFALGYTLFFTIIRGSIPNCYCGRLIFWELRKIRTVRCTPVPRRNNLSFFDYFIHYFNKDICKLERL